jgi:hypothetical protein
VEIGSPGEGSGSFALMDVEADIASEEDGLVIALTPAQLVALLAVVVIVFVLIRARRAR